MRIFAAAAIVCALCGCRDLPSYAVPEQRPDFANFRPESSALIEMSDPGAPLHFVRDILDGTSWRWTRQRPAVKVKAAARRDWKYVIEFVIVADTFKETGPVTIAFTVNDHVLDRVRYAAPGQEHFSGDVPREWIERGKDTIVGAEIDKVWTSKIDSARLGFVLTRMGLVAR